MLGLFANHILFLMPLQYHLKIVFRYLHVCFVEITTQKCFKCFYGRTTNEKTFSYFTWPFWIYVTPIILITRNNIYTRTVVWFIIQTFFQKSREWLSRLLIFPIHYVGLWFIFKARMWHNIYHKHAAKMFILGDLVFSKKNFLEVQKHHIKTLSMSFR